MIFEIGLSIITAMYIFVYYTGINKNKKTENCVQYCDNLYPTTERCIYGACVDNCVRNTCTNDCQKYGHFDVKKYDTTKKKCRADCDKSFGSFK